MYEYVTLSRVLCLCTSLYLIIIVLKRRYLLIKPSVVFLIFFNVQIQWSAAINAPDIYDLLLYPWDYFYLAHLFPLGCALLIGFTFRKSAYKTYQKLVENKNIYHFQNNNLIGLLALVVGVISIWYLLKIPLHKTGLYASLFNPGDYIEARQKGMQELDDAALSYMFSFVTNCVAPVLSILLAFKMYFSARSLGGRVFYFLGIMYLVALVSIFGARGPAILLLLCVIYAFFLKFKFPFELRKILIIVACTLTIPTLIITGYRSSESAAGFFENYVSILDRVFGRNIISTVWTVDYAQREGLFGIGGIQKLAPLFGKKPVDGFNLIALFYRPDDFESSSATSSFIFFYYSCFGLRAIGLCLGLVFLLDGVFWVYRLLPLYILVPCVSACAITAVKLVHTVYTSTLITGGYLLIPLFCLGVSICLHIFHHAGLHTRAVVVSHK
jgi:oligosaccharide repeat unit polymerase